MPTVVSAFAPASADLLARRALLRRVDSKYLLSRRRLDELLAPLAPHYAVLQAAGASLMTYRSLYFDTPDLHCFEEHRRHRRVRQKVRVRHYPDRELTFLELKIRRSELVTTKRRLEKRYGDSALGADGLAFLAAHSSLPVGALVPQVWTHFRRFTLLGLDTDERITVDLDLEVVRADRRAEVAGAAIVEVKQPRFCLTTPVMAALRRAHLRQGSLSKYCTALALTRDGLRLSGLRPALRAIEEVTP